MRRLTDVIRRLRVSPPVNQLRYHLYRDVLLTFPRRVSCNICGWRGRHFLTSLHRRVLCPKCGSTVRHRLIAAALSRQPSLARIDGGKVLHLSPEYCLGLVLHPRAATYLRGDYATIDADLRLDMTDMSGIESESVDVLVACDTLEHIPDDQAAIREAFRVLRPGGTAILTVPQLDDATTTHEDPAVRTPAQREAVYGQSDHVRNYGADFRHRLEAAGFHVTVVQADDFPESLQRQHVLRPPVPLAWPIGWNLRRIHFAMK